MSAARFLPYFLLISLVLTQVGRTVDPSERDQDIAQMEQVFGALMAYRKAKGQLPNHLGGLVPEFLPDPKLLLSPAAAGEARQGAIAGNAHVPSSYLYEWGPKIVQTLSFTEVKTCQVEEFGPIVPLLRC